MNGNYAKAKEHYEIAYSLEKNELVNFAGKADILKNLGRVYGLLGKYKEAIEILEECKSKLKVN